ncbi:MAG: UTP--glucose-1-phosphate uridylyltransferase GalU [Alphaproteobacteria bacterium]|nr:UTP--glucose-1-phosphate uridylyltransferase GalU [Alphaproteobacteria bacterium]
MPDHPQPAPAVNAGKSRRRVRKAIFPVGGLGTRFLPATKAMPKEMLPVVDRPLIQYAVDEARAAGIEEFIFVTGRGKTAIEDHFDESFELMSTLQTKGKVKELDELTRMMLEPGEVAYTRQQEPLGLGHAVWCARRFAEGEPVAVLLADDLIKSETPCLKQMIDAQAEVGGNILATMEVPEADVSNYGIVFPGAIDGNLVEVKGLVEKPAAEDAPSNFAVIGRYILQPEVFDHLGEKKIGAGGEIQLTDAMAALIGRQPFHGLTFEGTRFDCGSKIGFLEATLAFALDRPDLGGRFRNVLRRYAD